MKCRYQQRKARVTAKLGVDLIQTTILSNVRCFEMGYQLRTICSLLNLWPRYAFRKSYIFGQLGPILWSASFEQFASALLWRRTAITENQRIGRTNHHQVELTVPVLPRIYTPTASPKPFRSHHPAEENPTTSVVTVRSQTLAV